MNPADLPVPFAEPRSVPDLARSDEAAGHRRDPTWLAEQWRSDAARYIRIGGGRVRVRGQQTDISADWRPASEWAADSDSVLPLQDWALVGVAVDGSARFALHEDVGLEHSLALRELSLTSGFGPDSDATALVGAVGLMNWHETHRWCPHCGSGTLLREAGWMRECERDGRKHFPRLDPAVIMLICDETDRALLGRQARWPEGWYSTLAGFVEPGESFEAAVRREVLEEAGVVLDSATYRASQPWPFPSSIMIGFRGLVSGTPEPRPDGEEIVDVSWFTRDDLVAACTSGEVRLPPRLSISRFLIEDWYGAELPSDWSRG